MICQVLLDAGVSRQFGQGNVQFLMQFSHSKVSNESALLCYPKKKLALLCYKQAQARKNKECLPTRYLDYLQEFDYQIDRVS
jgi:hypothetical protein